MRPALARLTGKVVTLAKGTVVTDVGPAGEHTRLCARDDGGTEVIVARVIRELPPTIRRASVRGPLRHRRQLEP